MTKANSLTMKFFFRINTRIDLIFVPINDLLSGNVIGSSGNYLKNDAIFNEHIFVTAVLPVHVHMNETCTQFPVELYRQ
jgi:hypothetical protein